MPTLEYFLVASSISVDQATNNVSLFHILEEVSGTIPLRLPPLVAASAWVFSPEERGRDCQAGLRIHLPGGNVLSEANGFAVNFSTERRRHRVHQFLEGLVIPASGDVRFEILLNGEHQAFHTVTVHSRDDRA
jgi:hypothetical protein